MKLTGTQMLGIVAEACEKVTNNLRSTDENAHTLRCVTTETTYFTFTSTVVVDGVTVEVQVSRPVPK
jgi:hypothetical protein